MDVTERIDDIVSVENHFAINIHRWAHISPHSGVRLGNASGFLDYGTEYGSLRFPYVQRDRS